MCGIFGYIGNKTNAGDLILEGLKTLEYRGYDSWGVVVKTSDGSLHVKKRVGKIGKATMPPIAAVSGIGHTRWATHGGVNEINSHPHLDCKQELVIVHNGILENYAELKQKLSPNHTFLSETDTEVFAHLIEERFEIEKDLTRAVLHVFKQVKGMNAVIVFRPKSNEFVAIKNGSPLIFGKGNGEYFLASDSAAIVPHTKEVYYLEDYDLLSINDNTYQLLDFELKLKSIKMSTLPFSADTVTLGKHPNYMMKEMHEQPQIIRTIAHEQKEIIEKTARLIKQASKTYFLGCGTAYYAALAGTYLFAKIAKKTIHTSMGSEFSYSLDFLKKGSLVTALSQSGETIDIISNIKSAQAKGANVLALTNVLGSTLYRMADHQLLLGAGPEKCVLATKSYTAKVTHLYLLAHALSSTIEEGIPYAEKAATEIEKLLAHQAQIQALAKNIQDKNHIYLLGRGISYPTALEAALKIKEVSYIHAEGFAAGELKHGVIALIEPGTPVIVYNPDDETYEDTLSSAHEVKARGAHVIGISSKNHPIYDTFIEVKNCGDATIIPNVVVAQLLGYFLALEKGYDPDKPRNLAKSVTVK